MRRAPAWVTGEGEPYRPWLALVASRTHDHVLVPDIATARPDDGHLVRLVLRAIREAGIRPERLEVADAAVAARLAAALEPADIPVAPAVDGLPVIEKVAETLATAIAGPDTLRPLARVPGMTDALQRGLYTAAAEFYRSRPWRKLPSDTSLAVMFGEAFEISARDHDTIEQKGFEIAGPEAWPLVIRLEPGFATRPPLVWEVELITACLRDVVSRVARGGDRR